MTYRGRVANGTVVLEPGATLPEGTEVVVHPVPVPVPSPRPSTCEPGVWQKLLELEGAAQGLPADLPERHDHYRRQRLKP